MNRPRQKGTAAETALLKWLHANGHGDAIRNPPAGSKDVGDLTCVTWVDDLNGCVGDRKPAWVVIEVKHYGRNGVATAINAGLAELEREMENANADHGVLVVRRNGKTDPGEWLAIRKVRNDPEIGAL